MMLKKLPGFYQCISYAENPELTNLVLGYLSGGSLENYQLFNLNVAKEVSVTKKKSIMFYLVGHVFPVFCPRPQFSKNSNQNNQGVLQECGFLAGYTLGDK